MWVGWGGGEGGGDALLGVPTVLFKLLPLLLLRSLGGGGGCEGLMGVAQGNLGVLSALLVPQ